MDRIEELTKLLESVAPMLKEFIDWKSQQAEQEKQAQAEQEESNRYFSEWVAQKKREQAQQEADAKELQKHFYGSPEYDKFSTSRGF